MKIKISPRPLLHLLAAFALASFSTTAAAQISLLSAVDLAVRNSPRVKSSEADLARARAVLSQTKDLFIPSVTVGAAIGQAYGYSNYPPTLFNLTSNSLVYSSSQLSYVHSARAGVDAAQQSLEDMRETVAEDAALTFIALDHDQQREVVLRQETVFSDKLVAIVSDRLTGGLDTRMDLTNVKLTAANLHLALLRAADDTANDREHLARLIGIPSASLRADGGFPSAGITLLDAFSTEGYANASVASAFANARAKQLQARGDSQFLYRPQLSLAAQYNRYATFTNAWTIIERENQGSHIGANEYVFGVQISIPVLDRFRTAKGVESIAQASKAVHDAEFAQTTVIEAQGRLRHTVELVQAQAEVAALQLEQAQQQLEIVQTRLLLTSSGPVPATPADEQNAHIAEREKYMGVIDSTFQLRQAQVSLLRQMGHLEDWLQHNTLPAAPSAPSIVQPHP